MKAGLLAQGQGLIKSIDITLDILKKKRTAQVVASVAAEKIKDDLIRVNGDKVMFYSQMPECQEPDPKTGKKNIEWQGLILDSFLRQDEEYMTAMGLAYEAEQELAQLQADILDLSERVTADKVQCRLVAAMLGVIGDGD